MHHRSAHSALTAHSALIVLLVLLILAASLTVGVRHAEAFSAALGFAVKADFAVGQAPISIAVGDFNGDDKQDLVTANNVVSSVSVLLGNGSGGFAAKTDFVTGAGPVGIAIGDFNGDGKQDLATANYSASTVSVLLGNGSGGFGAKADFTVDAGPRSIAVGDFNSDGNQDLATANQTAGTVSILLGDSRGGFAAKTDFATGSAPYSIAVGDFNSDGKQDLAVANANFGANTVNVLLGNGGDGFGAKTDFATGSSPRSIAVGDFNRDGRQDLATANAGGDTASVLLGNGGDGFGAKTDFTTGTSPNSVAVGDFNGDGLQDLATADYGADTVSVLLNMTLYGTMVIEGYAEATRGVLVRIDSPAANAVQMRLRDQGGAWGAWQPYAAQTYWTLPAGDGIKTIEAQYRNSFGETPIVSDSILLDPLAPATTDNAPAGWQTTSPVTVGMKAKEDGSGMSGGEAKTQYKLDGAVSWTTGTSVEVGGDGAHTIAYRSIDAVGNVEETKSCSVKIDTSAPTTTIRGVTNAWQAWPQTVSLSAVDASSGMSGGSARIEYDLDGAGWTVGDWIVVATDGDHTLQVRATDAAGNVESPQTAHVKVDRTAPTTTDNTDALPHHSFSVVLTPSDALSGVAATSYRIDHGAWHSGTSVTLRIAIRHKRGGYSRGVHLIEYRSTDNAGNTETIESCTVTLGS